MWSRAELKSNAKNVLKKNYWMAFAVILVAGILIEVPPYAISFIFDILVLTINYNINPEILVSMVYLIFIICTIFIGLPFYVGKSLFYLSNREKNAEFTLLFSTFSTKHYFNIVKTMFLMILRLYLWLLLLIIPCIIKRYEYFMISYILAENPSISSKRAFQISKAMTKGHKFKMFVLQLSFIGWTLLGTLCCFVGVYFVLPYYEATFAELYAVRREAVLASGEADMTELCGIN